MNQIAYINSSGQLVLTDKNGAKPSVVSDGSRTLQFPAWSPDGSAIAAIARKPRISHGGGAIVIYDVAQGQTSPREVYQSDLQIPFYLYWSPDSRYLSFLASHPRAGMALHTIETERGITQLLRIGQPMFWMWRPNAAEILIHTGAGDVHAELSFIHPEIEYESQNGNIASPGHFQAPGISASNTYLAFSMSDTIDRSKIVIENQRTRQRTSFKHRGRARISWSPSADNLAYISPITQLNRPYGMLRMVNGVTGERTVLVEDEVLAFFWSPDGHKIAYFTEVQPFNDLNSLPEIESGYAAGRSMPLDAIYNSWLNLWVVDIRNGTPQLLTPFKPNSLFANRFLPFFDQYALSHRLWSPESDAILLPALVDDSPHIVVVPLNRFPPAHIGRGSMGSWRQLTPGVE